MPNVPRRTLRWLATWGFIVGLGMGLVSPGTRNNLSAGGDASLFGAFELLASGVILAIIFVGLELMWRAIKWIFTVRR